MLHGQGQGTFLLPSSSFVRSFAELDVVIHVSADAGQDSSVACVKEAGFVGVVAAKLASSRPGPSIVLGKGHPSLARVSLPAGPVGGIGELAFGKTNNATEGNGAKVIGMNLGLIIDAPGSPHVGRAGKPLSGKTREFIILYEKTTGKAKNVPVMGQPDGQVHAITPFGPGSNGGKLFPVPSLSVADRTDQVAFEESVTGSVEISTKNPARWESRQIGPTTGVCRNHGNPFH